MPTINTIRIRHATRETVQHKMIQCGCHNAWPASCETNLLLVMTAFGQFARIVEPIKRNLFTRPSDIESGPRKWIKRFIEACQLISKLTRSKPLRTYQPLEPPDCITHASLLKSSCVTAETR